MAVFAPQPQTIPGDALKMNQLCKVCGEPAAGFHFGAFTCEGCKSFFGRSYNNLSVISECKNGGQCVINKKNRTSCKACRLRKCLLVGMSKSGSRYGRRSNWFKLHCLMQEQSPNPGNNSDSVVSMASPAFHGLRRGFQTQGMMAINGLASSMSSNESKEDAEEYKNSTSPSVSSPGSHHSDSSLELPDSKPTLSLNPYQLKLGHPSFYDGKDLFPQLGMPLLPPHLQAAAAAAAAVANFQHQPLFPPRFLFPGMGFPLASTSPARQPAVAKPIDPVVVRKFTVDSMLEPTRITSSPELAVAEAEQETPMDLSLKKETKSGTLNHQRCSASDESDIDFDNEDTLNDDDDAEDEGSDTDGNSNVKKPEAHPLDLTRK